MAANQSWRLGYAERTEFRCGCSGCCDSRSRTFAVANSATATAAVAAVFGAAAAEFAVGSAEEAAAAQVTAGGALCSSRRAPDRKADLRTG
jgi:hypothetical protein